MTIPIAAARLSRDVPRAEASIDEALISVAQLMTTMVQARRDTGVAASTGQSAILRLAKAQLAMVGASNDVLRVHSELVRAGNATGMLDLHEECKGELSQLDHTRQAA